MRWHFLVKGGSLDVAYEVGGWLQVRQTAYAATLPGFGMLRIAVETVWQSQERDRFSVGLCRQAVSLLFV
jgi:hypothetical protein